MVEMNSLIRIGDVELRNKVNQVEINSGYKEITSTASIKIPRYKRLVTNGSDGYTIRVGMAVDIQLGYNGNMYSEFTGYVSSVSPTIPIEIKCEDEMWQLKQQQVSQSWKSITLKELIAFIYPNCNLDSCYDITLSPFRIDKASKAQVLQKLSDDFGITIYFRGQQLYAGLAYYEDMGRVNYHFQKNIVASSNSLVYKRKEDVRIKLKAISMLPDNSKITVEVGDNDGEQRTLHFYNIRSAASLKQQAEERLDKLKYDGFRGSFEGFGLPRVTHGMIAALKSDRQPEYNGSVFIDQVVTTYGSDGFKRKITVGKTANV